MFYRNIRPTENKFVVFATNGDGWHNYHHTFPTDYRSSEFGGLKIDPTATIIEFFAKIGWAYDLKTSSNEVVKKTIEKRGDMTLFTSMSTQF